MKRRCTEWSVYDIKVPRERFQSIRIHLLSIALAVLWCHTLIILCSAASSRTHLMISERSSDTEDWSNGCCRFSFTITWINDILKYNRKQLTGWICACPQFVKCTSMNQYSTLNSFNRLKGQWSVLTQLWRNVRMLCASYRLDKREVDRANGAEMSLAKPSGKQIK